MKRPRCRVMLALIVAALFALPHGSPRAQFGKNKVQYKDFHWRTIETDGQVVRVFPGSLRGGEVHAVRLPGRARPATP